MRAYAVIGGSAGAAIATVERPDPEPGPGEALVRVRAASLNYRDLLVAEEPHPDRRPPDGIVPLSDGAGEVVATGPGVTEVQTGDRVVVPFMPGWVDGEIDDGKKASALGGGTVDGMLAELVAVPAASLVPTPEHLSDVEAATLPCAGVTAWNALNVSARLAPGSTVLLLGTGGVSMFALQFAKLAGHRVIITSSSDEKLAYARDLGADDTINYRTTPGWGEAARAITGGRGVDHVVEVGGPGTIGQSLAALRTGGSMCLVGVLTGYADHVDTATIVGRAICVQGAYVGSRAMFVDMNAAIALHGLHPVVDRVFDFDDAPKAFDHLASGAHVGKVAITL